MFTECQLIEQPSSDTVNKRTVPPFKNSDFVNKRTVPPFIFKRTVPPFIFINKQKNGISTVLFVCLNIVMLCGFFELAVVEVFVETASG